MSNSMYSQFINKYSLSKTLRFELIPQGKTLEHIEKKGLISEDVAMAEDYDKIKKIIDEYHKAFIDKALSNVHLSSVNDYVEAYNNAQREPDKLEKCAEASRKEIVSFLEGPKEYNNLFGEKLITEILPEFKKDSPDDLDLIEKFRKFTTYFKGFHENRKNMYTAEAKSTAIAYRLIDQNLPKFIDNYNVLTKALKYDDISKGIKSIEIDLSELLFGLSVDETFSTDNYSSFLTQDGIDRYNQLIGGKSLSERSRVQGINEYINLHNQKAPKSDRVGTLKPLYKQILSDRSSISFLPEQFSDDTDVVESVEIFTESINSTLQEINKVISDFSEYNPYEIYVKNDSSVQHVSKAVYGDWAHIQDILNDKYDEENVGKKPKDSEKYEEKRKKAFKGIISFSIGYLTDLIGDRKIIDYYTSRVDEIISLEIKESYERLISWLKRDQTKPLTQDKEAVSIIKDYLDALKKLQRFIKPLLGDGREKNKDARFYGEVERLWEELDAVTPLYNKVRNYVTKKPYSTEKIKLNFENATLLAGWDVNKEPDNTAIILKKEGKYFLGIMSKGNNKVFRDLPECTSSSYYNKMEYKLLPGANKMLPKVFFSKSRIEEFNPSQEIVDAYKKGTHKKGDNFNLDECHRLIDFFKESINAHDEWRKFEFKFSPTKEYGDISEFYRDVENQGYKVSFKRISDTYVDELVEEGKLFLFQIYNKDFSPYSHGAPNLHTLYWKALFSEANLSDVVYKLNGEAEVFYRKASIKPEDTIIHPANKEVANKNELNEKKESLFAYDLIKDKRYTVDKFLFHVPITMNFKALGRDNINLDAREAIKKNDDIYVIGIDRGERHLIYVSVIDSKGNIVEQTTLNRIVSEHNGKTLPPVDYHALLDEREKMRDEERKNWQSIETIKELKEGYLSQVVHYIAKLMVKYNAIVVLEDLNSGFKRGRIKVEKQVYQKFERMLIEKLNYLVNKQLPENEDGGLLHAYQLASKFGGFNQLGKQSGMLFYTEAWNTSKIDPKTGFVNLFDTRYKGRETAQDFWRRFDSISYDSKVNMFAFSFQYSNFTDKYIGAKDNWTVYTNGERVLTYRNKNGQFENREVVLTEEFASLFASAGIDYTRNNLQEEICNNNTKEFHETLLKLFRLVLQMRNSKTGTEIDYIVSPVKGHDGIFFDSRNGVAALPFDADANGAYNIARKGLMIVDRIKSTPNEELKKLDLRIKNIEWLKYAQGIAE